MGGGGVPSRQHRTRLTPPAREPYASHMRKRTRTKRQPIGTTSTIFVRMQPDARARIDAARDRLRRPGEAPVTLSDVVRMCVESCVDSLGNET